MFMKRCVALLLVMFLSLSAAAAEGWVAPMELNTDEENMLSMLGMSDDTHIYEYVAPEGAKTARLTLQELQGWRWGVLSEVTLSMEDFGTEGRIVLVYRECLGVDLYASLWTENGYVSGQDHIEPDFDLWTMNISTDRLPERTEIPAVGVSVPLMVQCLSDAAEMTDADLTLYGMPFVFADCDRVYAVVVTFLDVTEAELYGWDESE